MMRRLFLMCCAAFAWLAPARPAQALGCILLGCDCTVSASNLDFGDFNPLLGGTHDAVTQIDVSCTGLLVVSAGVEVELSAGQWGSFAERRMRSELGDLLGYNIYTSAAHTTVWGDGAGGSQSVMINGGAIVLGSWSRSRDVFGRLNAAVTQPPGDYSDTVVVRVIW